MDEKLHIRDKFFHQTLKFCRRGRRTEPNWLNFIFEFEKIENPNFEKLTQLEASDIQGRIEAALALKPGEGESS